MVHSWNKECQASVKRIRKILFKMYKTDYYQDEYKRLRQVKCNLVSRANIWYDKDKIDQCSDNWRKLFGQLNKLLGKSIRNDVLPQCDNNKLLANSFKDFIHSKMHNINCCFNNTCSTTTPLIPDYSLIWIPI